MVTYRTSTPDDQPRIMEIWRKAVDATHHFLAPHDRQAIEKELTNFFPQAELTLALDPARNPVGFMYLEKGHLEALFIDPAYHGKGIGRALIEKALSQNPHLTTDVNAQNDRALGFYKRLGFVETGYSPTDCQGRSYPLIHLKCGL